MKKFFATFFTLLFILAMLIPAAVMAGGSTDENDIKKNLPMLLGANNVGKEFWFTIPPCFEDESAGFPNFIKIFVTSPVRTLVTVEVPGKGFIRARNTVPNDVIEYNITPSDGQPYPKSGYQTEVPEQVWKGAGIHVYADYPIVVYCVVRYHWTSDGFLAIPVSSLGKEYVVAGYPADPMFEAVWGYKLPNTSGVVAAYDNTKLKFTMGGTPASKTAGGLTPGQVYTATLMQGDVVMFSGKGPGSDLSGSKIVASKPVGVVTGNQCNNIPNGNQWCDYTAEMDLPTFTWGKNYHVGKVPGRKYPSIVRIFAKEPDTKIFRDGKQIGFLSQGGGVDGKAFIEQRIVGMDVPPRSAVFSGDKPIAVSLYNTGVQEDGAPAVQVNSDPFVMAITPIEQYQKEITFCTPGFQGTGFSENYINLVYQTDSLGICPDDVEFAQVFGGEFKWSKVRSKFAGVDELFRYDIDGKKYAVKTITLPGDGVYKIRAKQPFAAYSFGYSDYDSYGFPTSAALADLERPDTLPPDPKWTMHCGDDIIGATVTDKPDDPEVRSGLSMIVYNSDESFNYEFSYDDFEPGDKDTKWSLHVVDPGQDAKAVITFSDRRGNDTTITIQYFATKLTIRPDRLDFGLMKLGQTVTRDFRAINYSTQSPATVSRFELMKKDQGFVIVNPGDIIGKTIMPMDSIMFQASFTATKPGSFSDSLGIGDTCLFANRSLVIASVDEPVIEVTDYDFGKVGLGLNVNHTFQITNKGTVDLNITSFSGPMTPGNVYKVSGLPAMGPASPWVIAPKQSKTFDVVFSPAAVAAYPDSIVFFSDATRIDNVALINGEGIQPQLLSTSFDWSRKRINRPNFTNDGPYPIVDQHNAIYLVNKGTQAIRVSGITELANVNGNAFEIAPADKAEMLGGFTLEPKQEKLIPVNFNPQATGNYRLLFRWENSANIDAQTELKGTGIVPRIKITPKLDFGTTIVSDFSNQQKQSFTIENVNYEFADSVTITDLAIIAPGAIATDLASWGSEGFRFDKSTLKLPLVLQPDQSSAVVEAQFVAPKNGPLSASVTTVSDAESEVSSDWTGNGFSQSISSAGGDSRICVGSSAEIPVTVTNSGSGTITVTSVSLNPPLASLDFKDPADANGFDLAAGATKTIMMLYQPSKVEKLSTKVVITNTTRDAPEVVSPVNVEAVHFDIRTRVDIDNKFPVIKEQPHVSVIADLGGQDIAMASVNRLDVTISYNGDFLRIEDPVRDISVGSALAGKFAIVPGSVNIKPGGLATLTLAGNGNEIFNASGEILKFTLATYLPKLTADQSNVKVTVQPVSNSCLAIENTHDSLRLQPVCETNLRKIISYGKAYSLQQISPNPVGAAGTEINFSVGLESMTEIGIYNTNGQLVALPVSSVLQPGAYSVKLEVNTLGSGVYLCKMASGPFHKTVEMVVSK